MGTLQESKCTACRADEPRVTDEEIAELKQQIPEWQIVEREGIPRLQRAFRLKNFAQALDLTTRSALSRRKDITRLSLRSGVASPSRGGPPDSRPAPRPS
jgi:hypothetical protein